MLSPFSQPLDHPSGSPPGEWWVYVLECEDGTLYTGIAKDVSARFAAHCQGTGAKYTKAHRPRRVAYQEAATSRSEALKREHALKQLTREQKLAMLSTTEPAPNSLH